VHAVPPSAGFHDRKLLSSNVPKYNGMRSQESPFVARYHDVQDDMMPACVGLGGVFTVDGMGKLPLSAYDATQ
jgi:hypothetical protein